MIKAILVEDEHASQKIFCKLIADHFPQITICGVAASVDEAVKMIDLEKPSLLFLDTVLGKQTAFDLLEHIDISKAEIIFMSEDKKHAFAAIKCAALDYLVKPFGKDELEQAFEKIRKRRIELYVHEVLDLLGHHRRQEEEKKETILLPVKGVTQEIPLYNIIRCEGEDNYTTFFFTDGSKTVVSKTLKGYEKLLTERGFCRVHKSHLVNLHHVKSHTKGDNMKALMDDETTVPVSRSFRKEFRRRYEEHRSRQ